jgi:hypothetical protein
MGRSKEYSTELSGSSSSGGPRDNPMNVSDATGHNLIASAESFLAGQTSYSGFFGGFLIMMTISTLNFGR